MPTFIIAGAGKSGTSYLAHVLSLHPDIFMSTTKEPAFFSTLPSRGQYHRGLKFYAKHFLGYENQRHIAEGSTVYMYDPQSVILLKQHVPDVKLIFMLREPVSRVYSNYWQYIKAGKKFPHFKDMLFENNEHMTGMIDISKYIIHLERFLGAFPKEDILVLLFEDMKRNRLSTINRILEFLDLEPYDEDTNLDAKVNVSAVPRFPFIARMLSSNPIPQFIKSIAPAKMVKMLRKTADSLRNMNQKDYQYPEMNQECREHLERIFEQYNNRLALKFDLDLSAWKIK